MKQISYTRRQIFRAIQAACIALFLAAVASNAQAQIVITTPPFVVTGQNVTTAPVNTYSGAFVFFDNVNTYNSVTISSGVSITNTLPSGVVGPINGVNAVVGGATSAFTNNGTLSMSNSGYTAQGAVSLSQGATPLTFSNTGTLTTNATGANQSLTVDLASTTGGMSANNSGLISSTGAGGSAGVRMDSTSGAVSFTNAAGATVSLNLSSGSGYVVNLTSTTGNISFTNNGTVTSSSYGVKLGTQGAATASNTGTITVAGATSDGIKIDANGDVGVTNSGLLMGNGSATGIAVSSLGTVTTTNSGTITGFTDGIDDFTSGSSSVTNTGTINVTGTGIQGTGSALASGTVVNNSGFIQSGSAGIFFNGAATVTDSGNITSGGDSISVLTGSAVTLSGRPIINNTISGGANINSTSSLDFNLTISAANYAAARAQLDAEIQQYNNQGGGNLLFDVDTLLYNVSNFEPDRVFDNLVLARMFSNVPGFSGLGSALDNLPVNANASQILTALDNVSDAGLPNALAELSPKNLQVFRNIAFDNNTFYTEQINNHLANLRDGLTGFDSSAMSLNTSNMDPALSSIKDHLLAYDPGLRPGLISDMTDPVLGGVDMKDTKSMHVVSEPSQRWSTFISGNVILASLDNNVPFQNSQYTTGAVTAGADYRLDDNFTVGALFSYAHSGVDLDYNNSKATVDSYAPGIYASYVNGGWYANGLATYVRNSYTEDREIDIPGIVGDNHGATDGNQGTGNLTAGYEFQHGSFKFGPVATVEYVHLDVNSIQEQGPTALNIDKQSDDSLRTLIGFEGRFATAVDSCYGKWLLTPHFSASWQHESLDNSNGITASFSPAGGGSFATPLDQPERDSAFIDAGLDNQLNKTATVFVDYQVQVGQDDFFAQSVQGGVQISF
jgi:uncharacterized protein YhjY with autotransporter beta-barrel domain